MKYKRVFRNMDSMKSFIIASNVAELGYPTFSEQIPTAAVGIHPTTGRVEYMFNKEFYRSLSDEGLAFVIVHEMLHIAFDHPHRFKTILGKKHCDEFTEADQEKWKAFALAADCIVNTWCDHLGFPPPPWRISMFGS
jgi:predicted metal-dependent peptidase